MFSKQHATPSPEIFKAIDRLVDIHFGPKASKKVMLSNASGFSDPVVSLVLVILSFCFLA